MVCPVGFARFGKGTLATYGFGAFWGSSVGQGRECLWASREPFCGLVEILFNLNIDFLSNFQSLIETLDFLCHISMFWAGGF